MGKGGVYYFHIIRTGKPGEPRRRRTMQESVCFCTHHVKRHENGDDRNPGKCMVCNGCARFSEMSSKSQRVYQRGMPTSRVNVDRLAEGMTIAVSYDEEGNIEMADKLTHAFIATVSATKALNVAPRDRREWSVTTDMGEITPIPGVTTVFAIRRRKSR